MATDERCAECGHAASGHIPTAKATPRQHGCMASSGDKWAGSDYCSCSRAQEECARPRGPVRRPGHVDDCHCGLNATETVRYTDPRCAALRCTGQHVRDLEKVLERIAAAVKAANPDVEEPPPPDEALFEWMQRVAGVHEPPEEAHAKRPLRAAVQAMIPEYQRARDAVTSCVVCATKFNTLMSAAKHRSSGRRQR